MEEQEKYIRALIELHRGLERTRSGRYGLFGLYYFNKFQSCQQIHVLQISVAVLVREHYFWRTNLNQRYGQ